MEANKEKLVLIVAGEFPPLKTIGRIRTVKFVQHLLRLGWTPVVLTVDYTNSDSMFDARLLGEIPDGVTVYRAPVPDIELMLVRALKKLLNRGRGVTPTAASIRRRGSGATSSVPLDEGEPLSHRILAFFKMFLRNWIYIPDSLVFWSGKIYPIAERLCRKHRFSAVYTTLPPFSGALVGYKLKREFDIPWVVDYRDLWHGDVLREWLNPLRERLELAWERRLMKRADVVIAVSEQKTEYLRKLHPDSKARWETLTNGYDTELYEQLCTNSRPRDSLIRFTYTGRLFKNRRGYAFVEAVGQLVAERPKLRDRVVVRILGSIAPEIRQRYQELFDCYGIEDMFDLPGDVSYEEAMRAQVETDYLLLIVDTGATASGVIPGKLFEYVAAARPIFALTDAGATQEIIERAGIGTVVPATSVEQCKSALELVLARPVPERLEPNGDYLAQFNRVQIAGRLAAIFGDLAESYSGQ